MSSFCSSMIIWPRRDAAMLSSKTWKSFDSSVATLTLKLISPEIEMLSVLVSIDNIRRSRVSVRCWNSQRLATRLTPGSRVSRRSAIEMNNSEKLWIGTSLASTSQTNWRRTRFERSARTRADSTRARTSGVNGSPCCCFAFSAARASMRARTAVARSCSAWAMPWTNCKSVS